jgi:endonuclease/exonuclease/phosphatase family metal-dependent hydrolase
LIGLLRLRCLYQALLGRRFLGYLIENRSEVDGYGTDRIHRICQDRLNVPVITIGDFNCNVWDVPYRVVVEYGFVDPYRAAGPGDSTESRTHDGQPPIYPSDHWPVIADLRVIEERLVGGFRN